MIKNLVILALIAAVVWFGMSKLKQNKQVQQIQQAPVEYTKALQNDVQKAQAAEQKANDAIKKISAEVQKAADN